MINLRWDYVLKWGRGEGGGPTCSDHAEPNLAAGAVNVGRILDLADERAVVGELDLLYDDGGVAAHHVPGPDDALPENAIGRRVRSLLVVEDLREQMRWLDWVEAERRFLRRGRRSGDPRGAKGSVPTPGFTY